MHVFYIICDVICVVICFRINISLSSVRQTDVAHKASSPFFGHRILDRKSKASKYWENPLSWGVGENERAEGRKEDLKTMGIPFADVFNTQRGNMLEQEEHEEKREGCTCCGPMIFLYVTSILVMCNAAWVINQLQGSEGSLYLIQNTMFSVFFENSEPCFTSGAKLQLLMEIVSQPYACFRCSCMILNPPVPSSGNQPLNTV